VPSTAFSSTASDVLHAWLYCSRADSPVAATLQLLLHHARPSCTPTRSRPELAQRGHRHALHVAALHVVALHVVALHSSSSFSCCRTRACSGLAAPQRHPCTPMPRASLARATHVAAALLLLARRRTAPALAPPPFLPLTGMAVTARLGRAGALGSPGPGAARIQCVCTAPAAPPARLLHAAGSRPLPGAAPAPARSCSARGRRAHPSALLLPRAPTAAAHAACLLARGHPRAAAPAPALRPRLLAPQPPTTRGRPSRRVA
jgi:hypothetical protein